MKYVNRFFILLFVATIAVSDAAAQSPCSSEPTVPSTFAYTGSACASSTPFGTVTPVPLIDGSLTTPLYANQIVTLYGSYGNTESSGAALTHYNQGVTLAGKVHPLCLNGTLPGPTGCSDQSSPKIVFLVIGFSNCDVEICGGHADAWDPIRKTQIPPLPQLAGQACATQCPNLGNPENGEAWNTAVRDGVSDGYNQMSLLRQVYPDHTNPNTWLVNANVVVFDGALGGQTLEKWDPTSAGYYSTNECTYNRFTSDDPECNYTRVADGLRLNGYSEAQVQAVFIKSGDSFPTCDLQQLFCTGTADAFNAEMLMGDILRYLKCCKQGPGAGPAGPRYPNLQQVFISSRTYGGYANASNNGNTCLNPEPFAYELGFTVQRIIVAQINQDANITNNDTFSGQVAYLPDANGVNQGQAPWFDWGPYLWAYKDNPRNFDGLFWCGGQNSVSSPCQGTYDVISGDETSPLLQSSFWGISRIHPEAG